MAAEISTLRRRRTSLLIAFDVVRVDRLGGRRRRAAPLPERGRALRGARCSSWPPDGRALRRPRHADPAARGPRAHRQLRRDVAARVGCGPQRCGRSSSSNLFSTQVARSLPAITTLCFVVLALWGRALWRRLVEHDAVRRAPSDASDVLLVGAGEAARELISSMLRDPARRWRPVGMLDDDPRKQHLRVRGVPVLGPIADLEAQVERAQVRQGRPRHPERGQRRGPRGHPPGGRRQGRPQGAARRSRSSSPITWASATSATSTSPTCSAATSSTPTSRPSPAT